MSRPRMSVPLPNAPVPRAPKAAAAVLAVVAMAFTVALAGCEYDYDDGSARVEPTLADASQTGPSVPQPTRDPFRRNPVPETAVAEWVARALPESARLTLHAGSGLIAAGELRAHFTPLIPAGTYVLSLACRSQQQVFFSVSTGESELLELGLRCGTSSERVVVLPEDAALQVTVAADSPANFAYRLQPTP
ncbi:hypothetical protein PSET11_01352 [Arthrobacter ulcerisalmonis]|uniref:Uncharacterized protein n=1 Tax=Arthrobacter ulcerisalmonis TaxID=2483813 RepID=A0A3P5X7T3_9MICC|nr:hypothetical protein [Arthrobacter ulcerisalmonis]VDC24469.1 hypothetical protein PSET11_01352 [Arthrobacter ulcerisalmonis]